MNLINVFFFTLNGENKAVIKAFPAIRFFQVFMRTRLLFVILFPKQNGAHIVMGEKILDKQLCRGTLKGDKYRLG